LTKEMFIQYDYQFVCSATQEGGNILP